MRCLVTGASGHLGSFLTSRLLEEGAEVFALVRPESDLWRLEEILDRITIIRADLRDISNAADDIAKASPDVVFHLAWQGVTSAFKNDPAQITNNVIGGVKLFDLARSAGCRVWIGVGSQAEYGPTNDVLTEDTPVRPTTAYGVSKLTVGLLTRKLCELSSIRYVWLRLLATYGPKDDERHLIPSVICKLLDGERPPLTPGEQEWDYLYIEDAANAIYEAAVHDGVDGVFNLASGQTQRVRNILEQVRDLIDPTAPLGLGELPYPPDQPFRLAGNIDRLTTATNWHPKISLEEGLKRTVGWYKDRAVRV